MCESLDPIQSQPNGITVHIETAPRTITASTKVAAMPAAAVVGPCRLSDCAMCGGYPSAPAARSRRA